MENENKNIYREALDAIPEGTSGGEEVVLGSCAELAIGGSEIAALHDAAKYGLNDTMESFCRSVIRKRDIAGAYLRCVDNRVNSEEAYQRGVKLLDREDINHRLIELEGNRRIVRNMDKSTMLANMARVSTVSAADYFESDEFGGFTIKPIDQWSEDMRLACKGIEPTKVGWKLLIHDKEVMWDKIAKMQGYYMPDVVSAGGSNDMLGKSDEELQNIIDIDCEEISNGE